MHVPLPPGVSGREWEQSAFSSALCKGFFFPAGRVGGGSTERPLERSDRNPPGQQEKNANRGDKRFTFHVGVELQRALDRGVRFF